MSKTELYECVEGFATNDGAHVSPGDLAEAGASIMKRHEWAFRPFGGAKFKKEEKEEKKAVKKEEKKAEEPKLEQATAAPGEKRGAKK